MAKFVVRRTFTSYGYSLVEAETVEEAMKIKSTSGDSVVTDSGWYSNDDAKPYEDGDYIFLSKGMGEGVSFEVLSKSEMDAFKQDWESKFGWVPYFQKIEIFSDETPSNAEKMR